VGCKTPNFKVQGFPELLGKNGPRVVVEAVDARRLPRRSDLITKHLSAKHLRITQGLDPLLQGRTGSLGVRPTSARFSSITQGLDLLLQGLAGSAHFTELLCWVF
jgi:hypothetical protein